MTESRPVTEDAGGWRMLSAEQLRTLARRMIEVEPLLRAADQAQIVARLGWRLCDDQEFSDFMMKANSGLGLEGWSAELWLDDDDQSRVVMVTASVCDGPAGESAAFDAFRRDVFALASRALTEEFGAPTETVPGEQPELRWRLGVPILRLSNTQSTVALMMERASDLDAKLELSPDGSV